MTTRVLTLAFAALLFSPWCEAQTPLRPFTAMEAANLGLAPGEDTQRAGEPSSGDLQELPPQVQGSSRYSSYSANEMRGISNETFLDQTDGGRWCHTASSHSFGDIAIDDLPHDASVQVMRIWGYDIDSDDDLTVSLIRRCFPASSAGNVVTTVLAELTPTETAGDFSSSLFLPSTHIDNNSCSYSLRTRFSSPGNICAGNDLRLQKVRLQWAP